MSRTKRIPSESGIYHVTARGVNQQIIFEDDADRRCYLQLLSKAKEKHQFELYAWCLMSNHVHLIIRSGYEELSESVAFLNGQYARSFNERHGRIGPLFGSRFYSNGIKDESYLLAAIRYVHRNPDRAKICSASEYPWSSYGEYAGIRRAALTDVGLLLSICGGREAFIRESNAEEVDDALVAKGHVKQLTDEQAISIILNRFGLEHISTIQTLDKSSRDLFICNLLGMGFTPKRASRLSGISIGVIHRVAREARLREEQPT